MHRESIADHGPRVQQQKHGLLLEIESGTSAMGNAAVSTIHTLTSKRVQYFVC